MSGLRGYRRMCETEDSGGRRINRTRKEGATVRRIKKVVGKTNWYKDRKKYGTRDDQNQRRMYITYSMYR